MYYYLFKRENNTMAIISNILFLPWKFMLLMWKTYFWTWKQLDNGAKTSVPLDSLKWLTFWQGNPFFIDKWICSMWSVSKQWKWGFQIKNKCNILMYFCCFIYIFKTLQCTYWLNLRMLEVLSTYTCFCN